MNIPNWTPRLVASGGVGAGTGFLIGYALKKFLKILVVILGLLMTAVILITSWLEASGVITITATFNLAKFENVVDTVLTWGEGQVGTFVSAVSAAANASVGTISLVAGLVLGFKRG